VNLDFLHADMINTDLFTALYVGLVATLFALQMEPATETDVVELRWRRFATIVCAIIAVLLLVRITMTTVLYIGVILGHT
jgi:hypothetical protein